MILQRTLENKTILWLQNSNQYLIVKPIVAEIISLLNNQVTKEEIITALSDKNSTTNHKLSVIIDDISKLLTTPSKEKPNNYLVKKPQLFQHQSYYKINDVIIHVHYSTEYERFLVHPKFAHLETSKPEGKIDSFHVYSNDQHISFSINNEVIETWLLKDVHFFQGKFSMKIVEHMHQKIEDEWLGVFHASAISNGISSMLFLGDSGNGKSTSLALLQANGFTCLADDFVPVAAKNKHIYSFPSAISIKKNSLQTLLPIYPELENSAEYHFKRLNKIVRYIVPNNNDYKQKLPCKALVFIKYKKDSDIAISKISNLNALEQLVPDSWLSPKIENASIFLDWFLKIPCYQLTYSDNTKMINTVTKIFNDDL
ncbi:hypothetical protein [Tenacibaculum bernardetii]|uniref:hypothetical protein n=1 Tax=Tenacibaculum bernardetii TaxID=3021375 RepID=UPI0023B18A0C|nr:hypothetical protein [Tenacibaculum bernardetii]